MTCWTARGARIFAFACRLPARLSPVLALCLLAGCAVFQSPPQRGELLVAGHQEYLYRYVTADEAAQQAMLEKLAGQKDPDARTRLRHALLTSAPSASTDSLSRAVDEFAGLSDSDELTEAERNAVGVWRAEAAARLGLEREAQALKADVAKTRNQLEEAKKQIEQLTIIEQQLESNQPDTQPPGEDDGKRNQP